jgi:alpha-tubulin suppressor-like RCC1 family protein
MHLAFVVEPGATGLDQTLSPAVVVAVRAQDGSAAAGWSEPITLTLDALSGAASLAGECEAPPVGGTAVFDDLSVDVPGGDYRLVATSGGLEEAASRPFAVHDVLRAHSLALGWTHTCALDAGGAAWCWGDNEAGQLGDGTRTARDTPVAVATDLRFASLEAGANHTCGLTAGGDAWCWGLNMAAQLGTGATSEAEAPTRVLADDGFASLGAGWRHTCGVTASGRIRCWGTNYYGQIGDGTSAGEPSAPSLVESPESFVDVSGGYYHSCGLTADGRALCWGRNAYGEVGDGTQEARLVPTPVSGDLRFTSLSAGGSGCHYHTCGVAIDGRTYCWGRNYQRHLSSPDLLLLTPTPVYGDPGIVSVEVGATGVCGITAAGDLRCWGTGAEGQLGIAGVLAAAFPLTVRSDLRFSEVRPGRYHTCASTDDGRVYCWGRNLEGQLGNPSTGAGWQVPAPVWKPAG